MRRAPFLLCLTACGHSSYILPVRCTPEPTELADDEASALGFSAREVAEWFGDEARFEVSWHGRHSQTPPADTFLVTLGGVLPGPVQTVHTPVNDGTADECALNDRLTVARAGALATDDGQVTGAVEATFHLRALSVDELEISVHGPVELAEPRWIEVEKALANDLAPPEAIQVFLTGQEATRWGHAAIVADGPNYAVSVWKCDGQRDPGCIVMTAPALR